MSKPKAPPCPVMKPSFMDAMSDGRDLHRNKRASAQVATLGKAAGTSLIRGVAAKAAEHLGANAQHMDSCEPSANSKESNLQQMIFTFLLGIIVGMAFLRYLQTSSISGTLHRLSGYFRYIWRFTCFQCRTLSLCTCNCTCWFRRYQNSVYDNMANKGKGQGKARRRLTLITGLASAREFAVYQILHGFRQ